MTFDPDRPNAHAESRAPVSRRSASTDAEARALERLPALSLTGWDATFTESVLANVAKYGPSLSDAQWKHVARIGYVKPAPPAPRSPLELESSEVESQLDELLRLDVEAGGARCLQAVEEMEGRHGRLGATLAALADGDAARYAAARPVGFGCCSSCPLSPATGCQRCAAGTPHPGEACTDGRRTRVCRGIAALASLRARILDARGLDGDEIRRDMGLVSEKKSSG